MLGVRPAATPTCVIMPASPAPGGSHPGSRTGSRPGSRPPASSSRPRSALKLAALYDTILQDTHPKLVRRRNVEHAQLSTMYGGHDSPRPDLISLSARSRSSASTYRPASSSRMSSVRSHKSRGGGGQSAGLSNMNYSGVPGDNGYSMNGANSPFDGGSRISSALTTKSRGQTALDTALVRFTEPENNGVEDDNEEEEEEEEDREDGERCLTSLSTIRSSAFCRRIKSAVDREVEGLVNTLSQQCCDVLGPEACHECTVVSRQQQRPQSEAQYPTLHPSEDNFTKSILVARMMPGMSEYLVQTKLACGEIARETFRDRLDRLRLDAISTSTSPNADDDRGGEYDNRVVMKNIEKPPPKIIAKVSPTFFTSLRDLNVKHISETAPIKTKQAKEPDNKSFTEILCPTFISPKKQMKSLKPRFKANYDPPLLPKVRQNAQPSFFAGSKGGYQLPERPPDSMLLDQVDLGEPGISSRMSTNASINPPTPTQF